MVDQHDRPVAYQTENNVVMAYQSKVSSREDEERQRCEMKAIESGEERGGERVEWVRDGESKRERDETHSRGSYMFCPDQFQCTNEWLMKKENAPLIQERTRAGHQDVSLSIKHRALSHTLGVFGMAYTQNVTW